MDLENSSKLADANANEMANLASVLEPTGQLLGKSLATGGAYLCTYIERICKTAPALMSNTKITQGKLFIASCLYGGPVILFILALCMADKIERSNQFGNSGNVLILSDSITLLFLVATFSFIAANIFINIFSAQVKDAIIKKYQEEQKPAPAINTFMLFVFGFYYVNTLLLNLTKK